jgi:diacylglycerol kinase
MDEPYVRNRRSWPKKFGAAFGGWVIGTRGHSSFAVHIPASIAVVGAGVFFQVTAAEWCVLLGCITAVIAAELFNSAVETLARAVTPYESKHVAQALDIASGAVLFTAIGATIAGLVVFLPKGLAMIP